MSKEINLLIKLCKKGNQKAQMQVYNLHCEAMFFIAFRYLQDEEEAKDAMQEGFLNAFLKLDSFSNHNSFSSWLKKIIINQCLDTIKKKKLNTVLMEDHVLEVVDDTNWDFDREITKEMIIDGIERLHQKYQFVVKLYLIEGYDHTEISQILDIPVKTSRTHLHRGKLQLQELLKPQKYEARY